MAISTTSTTGQVTTARKPNPGAGTSGTSASSGEQLLANAQTSRVVVQGFVRLSESLEWELGQSYLRQRGNKAFISDSSPIPFVVNNDGAHSKNAATVLFESLVAAEKAEGQPPIPHRKAGGAESGTDPDIFVLELGIGVGLFARYFLDHFQELCRQNDKNYYDRLTYIAADKSERMLMDVLRHGVLANHPGRVKLRPVDAMEPQASLPADYLFGAGGGERVKIRAVFLNYLLDCLPAAALDFSDVATGTGEGEGKGGEVGRPAPSAEPLVKELYVRTLVARNVKLEDFTDMKLEALKDRAISSDPVARQELLEVYSLFASEYDYRPLEGLKPLTNTRPLADTKPLTPNPSPLQDGRGEQSESLVGTKLLTGARPLTPGPSPLVDGRWEQSEPHAGARPLTPSPSPLLDGRGEQSEPLAGAKPFNPSPPTPSPLPHGRGSESPVIPANNCDARRPGSSLL